MRVVEHGRVPLGADALDDLRHWLLHRRAAGNERAQARGDADRPAEPAELGDLDPLQAHLRRRPLKYIGFDGMGKQVRDALHPADLASLVEAQMRAGRGAGQRIYTAGGGPSNSMSLRELTAWCDERFGKLEPASDLRPRPYDIPWIVMDSAAATRDFGWRPAVTLQQTLEEIAAHARAHPDWLERSGA